MNIIEWSDIGLSSLRWLIGVTTGALLGLLIALTIDRCKSWNLLQTISNGALNFLRALPVLGLVPIIQYGIGVEEYGKIGLVAWATLFPVWLSVSSSMQHNDSELILTLQSLQVSQRDILKHYIIPKVIGGLILGIQVSIGLGWIVVVASELIGTYSQGFWAGGLGYKLFYAYELNNWQSMLYCLLIFGILGMVSSQIFEKLTGLLFPRSKGFNPILDSANNNGWG